MQTNCILIASNFASRYLYWLQIKFFNSPLFYLFTLAVNLWHEHGTKRWEQDFDKTFIWNQYEERLAILETENIKICGWTTKLEVIKMQYVCNSAMSDEYLQKISHDSVATWLRCGGYCCMRFVANFIRFPAVQNFWKSVKISQSYREFKGGNYFLRHSVDGTHRAAVDGYAPDCCDRLTFNLSTSKHMSSKFGEII